MADVEEDRLKLHGLMAEIYPELEIYYQPPTNLTLSYPCIVYTLSDLDPTFANNSPYSIKSVFTITLMRHLTDRSGLYVKNMLKIPYTRFITGFTSDNIVHNQFTTTI